MLLGALFIGLIGANQSFWLDEGASLILSGLPLSKLFAALQGDFHPPLFYLLLHFWLSFLRIFGLVRPNFEWLIRLPNIVFGAATIPVLYLFLKALLPDKKRVALVASLLLMVNPLHLYYSMELRMYSLNALLSLLSWLFLVKWMKKINHRPFAVGYLLFSLANLYTFYGALFNLVSQWLYVLWQHKNKLKTFVICNLVIGVCFSFWLPILIKQLSGGGYLTRVLPGWSEISGNLSLKSLGLIMAKFTLGRISMANKAAYAIFVVGISLYFFLASYQSKLSKGGKVLLVWFYASLALAVLVSFRTPVLGYWRFIFLIPAFVSILAVGLSNLPANAYKLNLGLVFLVFMLGNLIFWNTPSAQREDWRTAAKLISRDAAISIVNFPDAFAPLKFYAPGVYYYPTQESLRKTRVDLDQSLPLVLRDKKTIFVFDYLSDLTDPRRRILTWLKQAGFKQLTTHNINGIGFIYELSTP